MRTMQGRLGRGSSSQICDFMAKAWRALLHDGAAFAVILADHDQRAAGHAARGEVRQRIGSDIGAGGGFPRRRAAQRIVHRRRQRRGRGRLAGRSFEMHAEFVEDVLGVGQHVHQVRDRRALVAGHVETPDCSSALVTARIPSPRNSSPAPSRSFSTSFRNDRSAISARPKPAPDRDCRCRRRSSAAR